MCLATLLLLGSLGPAACARARVAPPKVKAAALRAATLDEVLAAYDGYCKGIETLSASGDLDLRDARAGKSHKVGVRLVAARGGRLYLKGSVAVVTALEVVADGSRFWFQVPSKKTVWTGAADAAASPEVGTDQAPYYALRPADVTTALIPEPLAPGKGDALVMEADAQSFSLALSHLVDGRGVVLRRIILGRDTLRPARVRSYDAHGDVVSEVSLAGWEGSLPRSVQIARPGDGYLASFSFSKIEANVAVPERAFAPRTPGDYKVVELH